MLGSSSLAYNVSIGREGLVPVLLQGRAAFSFWKDGTRDSVTRVRQCCPLSSPFGFAILLYV